MRQPNFDIQYHIAIDYVSFATHGDLIVRTIELSEEHNEPCQRNSSLRTFNLIKVAGVADMRTTMAYLAGVRNPIVRRHTSSYYLTRSR